MITHLSEAVERLAQPFALVIGPLMACAMAFAALAWATKGRRAWADAKAAAPQTRINLTMIAVDTLAVGPWLGVGIAALVGGLTAHGLQLQSGPLWAAIGRWPTVAAAVIVGDFVGYWRHRAQHSRWLWPAHAIHHSDTHLTWLSLERMHPIDRLGSLGDMVVLSLLGMPPWALAANALLRHYWGYAIHADVPWTLGPLSWVVNSPAMHRWHHVRDEAYSGRNFATVFSVWDRAFGTFYQPGPCRQPLGVDEDLGSGALSQYAHPLKVWAEALKPARRPELSS